MTDPQQPHQSGDHDMHGAPTGSLGEQYPGPGAEQYPGGGDFTNPRYAGPQYTAPAPTGPQTQPHPFGPGEPLSTKGFFGKLFDLSFSSYITPSIVTIVYILTIVAVAFGWLAATVVAWSMSATLGVLTLIVLGPVYALFALVLMRITLEFYVAVIRIAQDVKAVRDRP